MAHDPLWQARYVVEFFDLVDDGDRVEGRDTEFAQDRVAHNRGGVQPLLPDYRRYHCIFNILGHIPVFGLYCASR